MEYTILSSIVEGFVTCVPTVLRSYNTKKKNRTVHLVLEVLSAYGSSGITLRFDHEGD